MKESEQIAFGIVGIGAAGGLHAGILQTEVAVFGNAVKMIRDENAEAVVIACPDPTHAHLVKERLRPEKPVLCEKPLTDSTRAALDAGSVGVPVVFKRWHGNADLDPGVDPGWLIINAKIYGKNAEPKLADGVWEGQMVRSSVGVEVAR